MSTPPDLDLGNKTLETLYNTSQKSTLTFQKQHDILKSQESILYTLRDKYYEALVNKKWHEQDRDIYFEHDKHVSDLRQNLIDKSIQVLQEQRAYYRSSQSYHVNVNETVKNRDRKIKNLEFKLNSVEKEHSDMESLYQKRGAEIMELSADLKIARAESLNLKSTTDEFESKFNALKQKLVDQVDETRKFQNVSNQLKSKLDKSVGKRESLETRNEDLECQITAQKTELTDQLKIIEKMTHKLNEEVLQSKKQHDTFAQTESIFELKTIEMKNKIVGYQNEVSKYVTQTDVLKVKCQELGIRLTSTDKKYKSLKQDREKVVSKEYSTRRENVEINERYHALLERAMELIESDANKNVHLQKLISDNIRLCFRSGKRNNTEVKDSIWNDEKFRQLSLT